MTTAQRSPSVAIPRYCPTCSPKRPRRSRMVLSNPGFVKAGRRASVPLRLDLAPGLSNVLSEARFQSALPTAMAPQTAPVK